jgi:uncharacterized protein
MDTGRIVWRDLTVSNAEGIRDFYREVVGWEAEEEDMGGYSDFNMVGPDGERVAGICHQRGANAKVPPVWLVYIAVADLNESANKVVELGGSVIDGPRQMGRGRFAIIRDPAGAVCALYEVKE